LVLLLAPLVLGGGDAIRSNGTADEETLADEPRVLAVEAVDRHAVRRGHLKALALLEHILFELLPVVVAAGEDLRHQFVEVRLRRKRRYGEEDGDAEQERPHGEMLRLFRVSRFSEAWESGERPRLAPVALHDRVGAQVGERLDGERRIETAHRRKRRAADDEQ